MSLYVLALTDASLVQHAIGESDVHTESFGGIHAVCLRRAAVPPLSDRELRYQHALVLEIAARCRAILPARFGTLLTKRELVRFVREHREDIEAGFDLVRDRAQMTIRITGRRPALAARSVPASGRAYLERRRAEADPPLPAPARMFLGRLRRLATAERREAGAGALLATVYHLVNLTDLPHYARAARHAPRSVLVSGPWPPFAFAPGFA